MSMERGDSCPFVGPPENGSNLDPFAGSTDALQTEQAGRAYPDIPPVEHSSDGTDLLLAQGHTDPSAAAPYKDEYDIRSHQRKVVMGA